MKKIILTLFGVLLFGSTLPIMAQQRKGNVRSTAKTVTSIPMQGPAIVDNHLAFLGLSLGESASQISSKLIAKGMKVDKSFDDGTSNVYLTGTIDGVQSRVMIGVTAEKTVYNLNLYDHRQNHVLMPSLLSWSLSMARGNITQMIMTARYII